MDVKIKKAVDLNLIYPYNTNIEVYTTIQIKWRFQGMAFERFKTRLAVVPALDRDYRPAVIENREFIRFVKNSDKVVNVKIAIERGEGLNSTFITQVYGGGDEGLKKDNLFYIERLLKTLLWIKGGWKVVIGGPRYIGEYIKSLYTVGGEKEFDANFMSRVYEKPFTVIATDFEKVPGSNEKTKPVGRHLDGCRIGFDAGGSDRKVSAVIDGKAVYSEEIVWHPKINENPDYHYKEILKAMKTAASHMPRVDAIGISSAGIYINNRVMAASLFINVPEKLFEEKVKNMFLDIAAEMGNAPVQIANDGDVTALAGAMSLEDNCVLGIAMGTSEAAGFVDEAGNITGWLNELAFVPVDYNAHAMVDEWSGDFGCGVKYFSQDSVIKLAPKAGIDLDESLTPAGKLKAVQKLLEEGHEGAGDIFKTIGTYLGYAIAYYAGFYEIRNLLILGRVTSGEGGDLIVKGARKVLREVFPELWDKINLHIPGENERRVGQSIAAASLPEIVKE